MKEDINGILISEYFNTFVDFVKLWYLLRDLIFLGDKGQIIKD